MPDFNTSIDWSAVQRGLDWDSDERRDSEIKRRLEQRAKQYAAPIQSAESGDILSLLAFRLGSERYAVNVMTVRGVRAARKITRVPGVPRFYRGVVNVRGQIITVLDLRLLFETSTTIDDEADELVIVRGEHTVEIGLLAGHVEGVLSVPREAVHPVEDVRFVFGVTAERLVLLDIDRMLNDRRLIVSGKSE